MFLSVVAQDKVLTIDDIFDPVKKVNSAGTLPNIRWMKDGKHYLLTNEASNRSVPRLQKVNALTGQATPLFDASRMEAAFAALPGLSAADVRQLASRGSYDFNPNETAVIFNFYERSLLLRVGRRQGYSCDRRSGRRSWRNL